MSAESDAWQPKVLAIGCLDARGEIDLIRDFLAARALRASATLIPTSWLVPGSDGSFRLDVRPQDNLRADVEAAMARAAAVKVGVLGSAQVAEVSRVLAAFRGPVVYDPVLKAPGGAALMEGALDALQPIIAQASLVTLTVAVATALTGVAITDLESARLAASRLRLLGAGAVLLQGVPLPGESLDLLVHEEGDAHFATPPRSAPLPAGAGSALATAIAVSLTRGLSLRGAVREAHRWLHGRIAAAEVAGSAEWL